MICFCNQVPEKSVNILKRNLWWPHCFSWGFFICLSHLEGSSKTKVPFNCVRKSPVAKVQKCELILIFRTSSVKNSEKQISIWLVTPLHYSCSCSSICTETFKKQEHSSPFSLDPRIEVTFKAYPGIFSTVFSRSIRHLAKITSSQQLCQLKATGIFWEQNQMHLLCTLESVKKGPP